MKQWHIGALAIIAALLLTTTALTLFGTNNQPSPPATTPQHYTYTIVHTYPHDENAFTQGLTYANGVLYEGTGLYGSSTLRKVDLETGNVLEAVWLPDGFFGEGITIADDTIVQLTWLSQVGFAYDRNNLSLLRNFTYATEGWGITFNGTCLIMSDGTDNLYFLDAVTYQNIGHIEVHDGNVSVTNLNELEYVNGDVYANIWQQQKIAVIDQETGQVKAWIDLTGIENATLSREEVLNGIAYDAENNRLFVTGKNWAHLFEIELVPSI
jgi:glutamine cyclotransferase